MKPLIGPASVSLFAILIFDIGSAQSQTQAERAALCQNPNVIANLLDGLHKTNGMANAQLRDFSTVWTSPDGNTFICHTTLVEENGVATPGQVTVTQDMYPRPQLRISWRADKDAPPKTAEFPGNGPPPPGAGHWYICDTTLGGATYYPYTEACAVPWREVTAKGELPPRPSTLTGRTGFAPGVMESRLSSIESSYRLRNQQQRERQAAQQQQLALTQSSQRQGPAQSNQPATAGLPISQQFPHASLTQICGHIDQTATKDDTGACVAKRNQYEQEYQACVQYGFQANQAFLLKSGGMQENLAMQTMTAHAYGPGGLAIQGSDQTAALLGRLVTAAYHGNYGKTPEEFSEYAFRICIKGEPF